MARGSCPEIRTDCPYFEEDSIIASGVHISKRLRKDLGS